MAESKRAKRSAEKEAFWRLVLEEFRASGLSVRAFCRREGLAEPSFYAWRRTLQLRDAGPEPDAVKPTARRTQVKRNPTGKLVPLEVVEPVDRATGCEVTPATPTPATLELRTPDGFTLRFHPDLGAQQLAAVLGVIAQGQGSGGMLNLAAGTRIFFAVGATDMRKGFNGLQGLVTSVLENDPLGGHLFLFVNRRRDKLKILYWDGDGLAIWYKRLEQGTFQLPAVKPDQTSAEIRSDELTMLLRGIDLSAVKRRKRYVAN